MSKNLMCTAHKTNSKTYRDAYDRIFKKGKTDDVSFCLERDAKRCHRCNGLYCDTIGKDVCPYCGY